MSFSKRLLSIAIAAASVFSAATVPAASGASDAHSAQNGFSVDLDAYQTPYWYNDVTTKCYLSGQLIGVCTTSVGVARAKERTSQGDYIDRVMVRCAMKGQQAQPNVRGYSEHLTILSQLPDDVFLMAYSHEPQAPSVSYEVGIGLLPSILQSNASSGGTLDINNYSSSHEGLVKICYDYRHAFIHSSADAYSFDESVQNADYVVHTAADGYRTALQIIPKFEQWGYSVTDSLAYQQGYRYAAATTTIELMNPVLSAETGE